MLGRYIKTPIFYSIVISVSLSLSVLNLYFRRPENVERESEIVSQAGRLGAVTVATNMAGRGTDILLGGSPKGLARVIAKHLMLVKVGLSEQPPVLPEKTSSSDEEKSTVSGESNVKVEKEEDVEVETDEDVLSLPSVRDLAASLELWMPGTLSMVMYYFYIKLNYHTIV